MRQFLIILMWTVLIWTALSGPAQAQPCIDAFQSANFKGLTAYIREVRKDITTEMTTAALDEYLYSFWGFHHDTKDSHYFRRTWDQLRFKEINSSQIVGISVEEFVSLAQIAMEIEEPTYEYSYNSGESFANVLPTVARFMGKDIFQQKFTAEENSRVCESAWCAEEHRHANFFAQIIKALTGRLPDRKNADLPAVHTRDEKAAIHHLGTRQTYEWNAASGYFFLMAHTRGPLREALANILRDEIKHLTIMSAAYAYMFGPRPWKRFHVLLQNALAASNYQQQNRTGGDQVSGRRLTMAKLAIAHVLTEIEIRRYLKSLPLSTLMVFFDSPSDLPELGERGVTPEEKLQIERARSHYREERFQLAWWPSAAARKMRAQIQFAEKHNEKINFIIQRELNNFAGAAPNSYAEKLILEKMNEILDGQMAQYFDMQSIEDGRKYLFRILHERLRDYQIRNNRHEVAKANSKQLQSQDQIQNPNQN